MINGCESILGYPATNGLIKRSILLIMTAVIISKIEFGYEFSVTLDIKLRNPIAA